MAGIAGPFFDARVPEAGHAITRALRSHEDVRGAIASLLRAAGEDPDAARAGRAIDGLIEILDASGIVESALRACTSGRGSARDTAIRTFFLDPKETYTARELAELWAVSPDDVLAICSDDSAAGGSLVSWPDALAASLAFLIIRPFDIERALGSEFARVRPESWKTRPILLRLPRWCADRLEEEPFLPSGLDLAGRIEQWLLASMQPRTR